MRRLLHTVSQPETLMKGILLRLFFVTFFLFNGALYATERYGAIEIGGKGVKAYAIEMDENKTTLIYRDAKNITPQNGIQKEGNMDKGMIALISTNALFLKNNLMRHQHIDEKNIFIIASSAINKVHNKNELSNSIQNIAQQKLYYIDEKEESLYGFYGVVPKAQWKSAAMMDIGGGNTKVAWFSKSNNDLDFFEIPLGTASLSKAVESKSGQEHFQETCQIIAFQAAQTTPKITLLADIETLYVSGGVFWATAYLKTNRQVTPIVTLEKIDFSNIRTHLEDTEKDKIQHFVQSSYGTQNIIAGSILAEVIIEKMGFFEKKIYFAKDGAWVIGWLLFRK